MTFDAVLVDMDGTMIDSLPVFRQVDRDVFAAHGYELTDEVFHAALPVLDGSIQSLWQLWAALFEAVGAPWSVDEYAAIANTEMARRFGAGLPWMPGARELLAELTEADVPTALVTSAYRAAANAWLSTHTHPFRAVVALEDVSHPKPDPAPYRMAADLLGVKTPRCLVLEDTPSGAQAGVAAGCRVVGVRSPRLPVRTFPPGVPVIPSLEGVGVAELFAMA